MKLSTVKFGVIFLLLVVISACGGGGGGTTATTTTTTTAPSVDPATTAAIQSYMSTTYTTQQSLVASNMQACERQASANGTFPMGAISCDVAFKKTSVQNFLNSVLAYIQTVKTNKLIDKTAIQKMLNSYQPQDLSWLTANLLGPGYTMNLAELAAYTPAYDASVNGSYSTASLQLYAM